MRRTLPDDTVTGQDQRRTRGADDLRGLIELVAGRFRRVRRLYADRMLVDLHLGNVFGEVDEDGARLFGLRDLECLAYDFRHDLGFQDLGGELGDRSEHLDQVEDLVAFLVQPGGGALPGDRDDRRAVHVGIGHTGDQVGGARAQRRHAHAGTAGQSAIHVGHEGRALFMMGGDELDGAVEQRIHDANVFFARDAEDVIDLLVFKTFYKQLCSLHQIFSG